MEVSGLILCGGQSRRFGPNKLKLKIGRLPLIINQIFKLSFFCTRIILSTSIENKAVLARYLHNIDSYAKQFASSMHEFRGKEFFLPPIDIVEDNQLFTSQGHSGPMIGLYSGLQKAGCKYSLVAAADMPLIGYKLLSKMKSEAIKEKKDAYIIRTGRGYESLCGIYSRSCLKVMEKNILNSELKISDCYPLLDVKILEFENWRQQGIDELNFLNINRKADYQKFKQVWGPDSGGYTDFISRWSELFFR